MTNDPLGLTPNQRAASDHAEWIDKVKWDQAIDKVKWAKVTVPRRMVDPTARGWTRYDIEGEIVGDPVDEPAEPAPQPCDVVCPDHRRHCAYAWPHDTHDCALCDGWQQEPLTIERQNQLRALGINVARVPQGVVSLSVASFTAGLT